MWAAGSPSAPWRVASPRVRAARAVPASACGSWRCSWSRARSARPCRCTRTGSGSRKSASRRSSRRALPSTGGSSSDSAASCSSFLFAQPLRRGANRAAGRALGARRPARAAGTRHPRAARPAISCSPSSPSSRCSRPPGAARAWDTVLSYVNATPFGRTDPLFGRDLGFFVFELPALAPRLRLGHRARGGHDGADRGRLRAPAKPRAHRPRARASRRERPDPSPGARRALAGAARRGLLARPVRPALLAARHRLRRVLHRRPRLAARPRMARRPRAALRRRLRLSDLPSGLALPRRRSRDAGPLLDRRPRRVPVAAPALSRHAERAGRRAPVHPAQHPDDPAGVRARPRGREGLRRRGQPDGGGPREATSSRSTTSGSGTTGRCS